MMVVKEETKWYMKELDKEVFVMELEPGKLLKRVGIYEDRIFMIVKKAETKDYHFDHFGFSDDWIVYDFHNHKNHFFSATEMKIYFEEIKENL